MNVALVADGNLKADKLFYLTSARDNCLERFYLLRQALKSDRISCRTADMYAANEIDVLLFHDFHHELKAVMQTVKANPYVQLIYIPNEPWIINPLNHENILPKLPVDLVLTWDDRIANHYPHVVKCNMGEPVITEKQIPSISFQNKKMISCIFSNKSSHAPDALYEERIRAIEFFSKRPCGLDLYGIGWETSKIPSIYSSYKGRCERKKDIQQQYKFSIAYENVKGEPGYISEKIFDCFAAGTVPVYYGAPNIGEYIPASCFVDFRRFRGYEQLYNFLVDMSESEYQKYIDAIKAFISSSQYHEFTSKRYAEIVVEQIKKLTTQRAIAKSLAQIKYRLLRLIVKRPHVLKDLRRYRHFMFAMISVW